ncbi:MAG: hypothetical protein FJ304_21675 [Planctomycetes bacterium]|nr:hypothetical protein [Planctomycetota bacterium]
MNTVVWLCLGLVILCALPLSNIRTDKDTGKPLTEGERGGSGVLVLFCLALLVTSLAVGAEVWDHYLTPYKLWQRSVYLGVPAYIVAVVATFFIALHGLYLLLMLLIGPAYLTPYLVTGSHQASVAPIWYVLGYTLFPVTFVAAIVRYWWTEGIPDVIAGVPYMGRGVRFVVVGLALLPVRALKYLLGTETGAKLPTGTVVTAYLLFPLIGVVAGIRCLLEVVGRAVGRFVRWLFYGRV